MGPVAGDGPEEKPRGGKRQSVDILLRAFEAAWREVKHHLVPAARPEIAQLVREVHAYLAAERSVDPTVLLPRWRKQVRTEAAGAEVAVPRLFDDLRILCSWTNWTELVGLEPETAMAFRTAAAGFRRNGGRISSASKGPLGGWYITECPEDPGATMRSMSCSIGSTVSSRRTVGTRMPRGLHKTGRAMSPMVC